MKYTLGLLVCAVAFYIYAIISIIEAWKRGSWIQVIALIVVTWLTWHWMWYCFLKDGLRSTKESDESEQPMIGKETDETVIGAESDIEMPDFTGWSNEEIEKWFNDNDQDDYSTDTDIPDCKLPETVFTVGFDNIDMLPPIQQMSVGELDKELDILENVIKGNPGHELEMEWSNRADALANEIGSRINSELKQNTKPKQQAWAPIQNGEIQVIPVIIVSNPPATIANWKVAITMTLRDLIGKADEVEKKEAQAILNQINQMWGTMYYLNEEGVASTVTNPMTQPEGSPYQTSYRKMIKFYKNNPNPPAKAIEIRKATEMMKETDLMEYLLKILPYG